MKLNEEVALFLLDSQHPRRKRLLENLLAGKKTVATIYWALRYQLLGYLGMGRYLGVVKLNFKVLEQKQLVKRDDNQTYVLTEQGLGLKNEILNHSSNFKWQRNFQTVNFMRFKNRLLLFIQVISEYQHQQRNYYPVNVPDSEMGFVKYYFKMIDKTSISNNLKNELLEFFTSLNNDKLANLFANELVGFQNNGKALFQIASDDHESLIDIYLSDLEVMSRLIDFVNHKENSVILPLLEGLQHAAISESALLTLKQYLISHDLNKVAQNRHLKESTIFEHFLELAIYFPINKFPYSDFIEQSQIEDLKQELGSNIDSWKYESLAVVKNLSFFQFRLVEIYLTKVEMGD